MSCLTELSHTSEFSLGHSRKIAQCPVNRHPDYIPPCRPYGLVALTRDLIALARYLLVPRGRLVFFLPTVTEEYQGIDIPVVEGMRELKVGEGSVQDFGAWSRRVSYGWRLSVVPRISTIDDVLRDGCRDLGCWDSSRWVL